MEQPAKAKPARLVSKPKQAKRETARAIAVVETGPETIRENAELLTGRTTGLPCQIVLGPPKQSQLARMKLPIAPVVIAALSSLLGCSSSPLADPPSNDTGAEPGVLPSGSAGTAAGASAGAGAVAVGPSARTAYPAGPYGTIRGATIENLSFLGWKHPDAAGYDPAKFEPVSLSDFYDPDGHTGVKILAINASAVWCSVCRAEYEGMHNDATYDTLRPEGLEILGTLFQDNAYYPAQPQDLKNWGALSKHAVQFPLGLDPGFKLGAYFDSDATPLNMLVDVRTMTIVKVTMGISATYWADVQALLEKM